MDGPPSTQRPSTVGSGPNLTPYITVVVLVTGVVGGLVLVISVILFCKYCIKKKKVLKRQPALFRHRPSSAERSYKQYSNYDNVEANSEASTPKYEHITKVKFAPDTKLDKSSEEEEEVVVPDEECNIDMAVAMYKESLKGEERQHRAETSDRASSEPEPPPTPSYSVTSEAARRVSFLVLGHHTASWESWQNARSRRRYTDGDFHQLKMLRVDRPKQMNKQRSLGAPVLDKLKEGPYDPLIKPFKREERPKLSEGLSPLLKGTFQDQVFQFPDRASSFQDHSAPFAENVSTFPERSSSFMDHTSPFPSGSAPMMDAESPSPPSNKPHRTEVSVEVHRVPSNGSGSSKGENCSSSRNASPPKILETASLPSNKKRHSQSLEMVSPTERLTVRCARRVKSYEGELHGKVSPIRDYDRQEITQFIRGPFYNADYDVISEGGSELRSKVRYNDTGSFEEVNEDHVELLGHIDVDDINMESSDDTETLNGASKYRELWNLRATLEDDEDFSDTIRMEDYSSTDDHSPEGGDHMASVTTSFESNLDPHDLSPGGRARRTNMHTSPVKLASANLLHPNYESRRQTYRSILTKRLKRIEAPGSTDNSFDSIETMDTDGEVSDTSRHEVTTTSFESTTDNTDSTGENNTHRLQQMRGDSGYKSLETQQTLPPGTPPSNRQEKKQIQFQLDPDQGISADLSPSPEDPTIQRESPSGASTEGITRTPSQKKTTFERRNGKTASKKRREYSRERQTGHIYESLETDSKSDQFSGDSFDEGQAAGKLTLFSRFFKSYREKRAPVSRDYSIDEKTNAIYHEFMRYDPRFDPKHPLAIRSRSHLYGRHRLHRKHTDSLVEYEARRRDKLRPEMRSASLGSDSSASSVRRMSPQDSIEEEYIRGDGQDPVDHVDRNWAGRYRQSSLEERYRHSPPRRASVTIHEIPIIKLPEEDSTEV